MDKYTKIHKYIRDDYGFAGFDAKVFAIMLVAFFIGLLATNTIIQSGFVIGTGIWLGFRLQEFKDSKLKGALRQVLYYFGFFDEVKGFKRIPPSYIKEFIG